MNATYLLLLLLSFLMISCEEGYKKSADGKWSWIVENAGGTYKTEMEVDPASFKIMKDKQYAKDKTHVFYRGIEIDDADVASFELLGGEDYSRDKNYVFLHSSKVIFANPKTFQILQWPYSKDDQRVFNGNIPMEVDDVATFEVTKTDVGKSSSSKNSFVEYNPEYQWLDTIDARSVIVGSFAEAKTANKKYIGFKEVE